VYKQLKFIDEKVCGYTVTAFVLHLCKKKSCSESCTF